MAREAETLVVGSPEALGRVETRRSFLRTLGAGGSVVLLGSLWACDDKSDGPLGPDGGGAVRLDLRTDVGILNYAYALEQLEAAFYTAAVARFGAAGITNGTEQSILVDIRDHEVIHREFLKRALGSAAIGSLEVDFGAALNTRQGILEAARTFEDLGVAAYNGAGKYLSDARNLLVAGKIVSVEARHAAVIRDLLDTTGRAFAGDDVVDGQGLDRAAEPSAVLGAAGPFITTDVTISNAPAA
jgi:hypothetical protein